MKYAMRAIALPFFAAIALISVVRLWVQYCYSFLRYGGEAVAYTKKHRPETCATILNYLKTKLENEEKNN